MARFVRIRNNEFLNLDKVVTYSLKWAGDDFNEKYFIRFLTECKGLRWVETDKMDLQKAEQMIKEIQKETREVKNGYEYTTQCD